jgi:hypothetical protein
MFQKSAESSHGVQGNIEVVDVPERHFGLDRTFASPDAKSNDPTHEMRLEVNVFLTRTK